MSNRKRQLGLFGTAGVLVAALIIAGFVIAGNILQVSGKGVLTIQVMDKPADLEELWLTIEWVKIQHEDGSWEDLELVSAAPYKFDLLTLQDHSETLSTTSIPVGSYKMIRMNVSYAEALYPGETVPVTLNVPSDVLKVILEPPLNLVNGEETTVLIDLQPVDISEIAISHSLNLRPVVKARVS